MMKVLQAIRRRILGHKELINKYRDPNTIFIYQMGKVGSTSLEQSIDNGLHVHAFYNKNHTCPVRLQGLAKFGLRHLFYRAEQEVLAYIIRRTFRQRHQRKIITLVREPMERNMSMFFHDIDAYLFSAHTNCMGTPHKALSTRSQDMGLLTKVFEQEFNQYYPLNWFQNEFFSMTGVNVFAYPFDHEKGMVLIVNNDTQVLCLRTDKIDTLVDELSEFVGHKVKLAVENNSGSKWYGDIYAQFKQQYQISQALEKHILDSELYQHFFVNK